MKRSWKNFKLDPNRGDERMDNKIKIICSNCSRTDYYKVRPNYCAFCGKKFNDNSNHKK